MMNRPSPSSSGLLPMPGTASSSWAVYRARLASIFRNVDVSVLVSFWFFGLINNVLYVIILAAAQDLVGSKVPKGVVLLADVMPSFGVKLIAPYFIDRVPYALRILVCCAFSSAGMLMIALTPADTQSLAVKLAGVIFASLSSGGGELTFLGLTHYYGQMSLAAWGSGTGAAGLAGAGLYVTLTTTFGFTVRASLLLSALLPAFMLLAFFVFLPHGPLRLKYADLAAKEYDSISEPCDREQDAEADSALIPPPNATSSLLGPHDAATTYAPPSSRTSSPIKRHSGGGGGGGGGGSIFMAHVQRAEKLLVPYMIPLFLVYASEYTINQGVAPTLLFNLAHTPFAQYRSFYPFYSFLYQLGVFISRSSTPFFRVRRLYLISLLQVANLVVLTLHATLRGGGVLLPSVYFVFVIIFWEGLLGGAVYVNTFSAILEEVPAGEREFSLSSASVSDSAGIVTAGFVGMVLEVVLCDWQAAHGQDWCKRIESS